MFRHLESTPRKGKEDAHMKQDVHMVLPSMEHHALVQPCSNIAHRRPALDARSQLDRRACSSPAVSPTPTHSQLLRSGVPMSRGVRGGRAQAALAKASARHDHDVARPAGSRAPSARRVRIAPSPERLPERRG
jgi:hypothetical protein